MWGAAKGATAWWFEEVVVLEAPPTALEYAGVAQMVLGIIDEPLPVKKKKAYQDGQFGGLNARKE